MKAWEILKHLQEGKKLTHTTYREGQWIALTCDIHGNLGAVGNDGGGCSLLDILDIEDDDGWMIYESL